MATGARSRPETDPDPEPLDAPEISRCESSPGNSVFLERGNSEGWIASDLTVPVTR